MTELEFCIGRLASSDHMANMTRKNINLELLIFIMPQAYYIAYPLTWLEHVNDFACSFMQSRDL